MSLCESGRERTALGHAGGSLIVPGRLKVSLQLVHLHLNSLVIGNVIFKYVFIINWVKRYL